MAARTVRKHGGERDCLFFSVLGRFRYTTNLYLYSGTCFHSPDSLRKCLPFSPSLSLPKLPPKAGPISRILPIAAADVALQQPKGVRTSRHWPYDLPVASAEATLLRVLIGQPSGGERRIAFIKRERGPKPGPAPRPHRSKEIEEGKRQKQEPKGRKVRPLSKRSE